MATPRETLKYYFRKYALPTEQQFAELIDAFVHKDEDMLTQEKIDGLTAALEGKVSTETLDQYKAEVQAMIENATTGGDNLSDRMATAEDNISGHELRIKALEQAEGVTIDEYLSDTSENPVQNKTVSSALSAKANQEEFLTLKTKIETFLEDTDASNETINKWQEIENFLRGITDTETLTGLLQDLKAEIIALIPEPEPAQQGNFVKQVADLDGYTEAQDGEIVQYVGQTTDNYTRGFFYERKTTEAKTVTVNEVVSCDLQALSPGDQFTTLEDPNLTYWHGTARDERNRAYVCFSAEKPTVGSTVYVQLPNLTSIIPCQCIEAADNSGSFRCTLLNNGISGYYSGSNLNNVVFTEQSNTQSMYSYPDGDYIGFKGWTGLVCINGEWGGLTSTQRAEEIPSQHSWQVIPVGPCVG